jgi:hypothetical protein
MELRRYEIQILNLIHDIHDAETLTPELLERERDLFVPLSEINRRTGIKVSTLKKWCRNHLDNVDTPQKMRCDVRGKRKTIYACLDDALECAERARRRTSAGRRMR